MFVSQIKALKGSDASNVHDEEPADDELEFSDDEAEAAYRSCLKRRYGTFLSFFHLPCLTFMFLRRGESRSRSVVSSRQSTPNPSQMLDQELADEMYHLSRNAYDAHGPYDVDFDSVAGPSRPPPIPYDDPYADDYTAAVAEPLSISLSSSFDSKPSLGRSSGSGHGYHRGEHHVKGRGRGRDRDRGQRGRGKWRRGGNGCRSSQQHMDTPTEFDDSRGRTTRSMSPTSLAIARATGQVTYNGSQHQQQQQQSFSLMYPDAHGNGGSWGYNHVQPQTQFHQPEYGYMQQSYRLEQAHMQAPLVQPHINPRFASAFGMAINAMQQLSQIPSTDQRQNSPQNTTHPTVGATNLVSTGNSLPVPRSSSHWTDEWMVHHGNPASYPGGESKNIGQ